MGQIKPSVFYQETADTDVKSLVARLTYYLSHRVVETPTTKSLPSANACNISIQVPLTAQTLTRR